MNFDEAVQAHSAWKSKLSAYIRKPDRSVNAAAVGMDNLCALGKWLHGDGAKYAADPDFAELKRQHARFHTTAAAIIQRADNGEQVQEELSIGGSSDYAKTSGAVVQLIMKMKAKSR